MLRALSAVVLAVVLAACSSGDDEVELAPPARPSEVGDLSGRYLVNGVDPLGSEYGGTLTISGDPSGYRLSWIVTGSIQEGDGEVVGNRLEVRWRTVDGPLSRGEASYVITSAGELDGVRTVDGYVGSGSEQAFPAPVTE